MTYLIFLLSFIALTALIAFITHRATLYNQNKEIATLWDRRTALERFVRPYQNYTYIYDTYAKSDKLYVDDKTASDIDLDALFNQMNFCFTAIGEMHLYAALRGMFKVKTAALIDAFQTNVTFRLETSRILAQLGKRVYPSFPDQQTKPHIAPWPILLSLLPIFSLGILFYSIGLGILITLTVLIFNSLLSMRMNKVVDNHMKDVTYTLNVIRIARELQNVDGMPQHHNIDFKKFKQVKRWSGFLASPIQNFNEGQMIQDAIKQVFFLDYTIFYFIQRELTAHEESVMACYDLIADVDAHYAVSLWRDAQDVITETTPSAYGVQCEGLAHPLITDPVCNDFNFDGNILLTGSNASGKSSFMKAIALNIVIAEMSGVALADRFEYQPGIVRSSMANQDDVLSGDSYFIAEIKSIKRLVNLKTPPHIYCFIDEIFKGTNTRERVAASTALLLHITKQTDFQVMAATHDIELTETLDPVYKNYHFNEVIKDNTIHFDYKVKLGPADTSNAIELLRIYDFPTDIYTNAKTQARKK